MSHNPDSLMPVCVGYNDSGWTYKVKKGTVPKFMLQSNFTHTVYVRKKSYTITTITQYYIITLLQLLQLLQLLHYYNYYTYSTSVKKYPLKLTS